MVKNATDVKHASSVQTPWLTTQEAARYLRTTRSTIYILRKKLQLPSHLIGGRRLFHRDELDEWARQQPEPSTEGE